MRECPAPASPSWETCQKTAPSAAHSGSFFSSIIDAVARPSMLTCALSAAIPSYSIPKRASTVKGDRKARQNDRTIRIHAQAHHSKHTVQAQISEHVRALSNEMSILVHVGVHPRSGDGGTVAFSSKRCALVTLESYIVIQKAIF